MTNDGEAEADNSNFKPGNEVSMKVYESPDTVIKVYESPKKQENVTMKVYESTSTVIKVYESPKKDNVPDPKNVTVYESPDKDTITMKVYGKPSAEQEPKEDGS